MKAYIIRIELCESDPIIWRRFILPAHTNYKKLHQVIQSVTNFVSDTYDYHLYEFDLAYENTSITNDREAYEDYQDFKRDPEKYLSRVDEVSEEFKIFEMMYIDRISKIVKQPGRVKISNYLERYGSVKYFYDFGDSWEFDIVLEEIIDDYEFEYPVLLAGEHDAPPEDVGGVGGFYDFLEIINDENHPEREGYLIWADSNGFQKYNEVLINERLKQMKI